MTRVLLAALALACVCSPALAQEANTTVTIPWGTYISDVLMAVTSVAVPIVATFIVRGIQQVAPWAALFLSQRRVEEMVRNGANFGLNAVIGVTKGKTISLNLGWTVIATAVKYILDHAPARVIAEAGGLEGIAHKIFRLLDLDEAATVDNTLTPAIAEVRRQLAR